METPKTDEKDSEDKEIEKVVELTDDEQDSLIDDDDKLNLANFTINEPYLRRECKSHLEPNSILSAKKTFRQLNETKMDKELKEQNLPTDLNLNGPKKTYRAQTKGKFIEAIAQGNA